MGFVSIKLLYTYMCMYCTVFVVKHCYENYVVYIKSREETE